MDSGLMDERVDTNVMDFREHINQIIVEVS